MYKLIMIIATCLIGTSALAADMRCEGDLMTPGTILAKVRAKCGNPLSEDRVGEMTVVRNGSEQMLYITQMTYETNGGYFVLTFEGGYLKKTEFVQR